jgi:hypothetical protein
MRRLAEGVSEGIANRRVTNAKGLVLPEKPGSYSYAEQYREDFFFKFEQRRARQTRDGKGILR